MPEELTDQISCSTLVRAERDKTYDAMTTAEGLDGWFTVGATVERREGGKIHFRWKDWGAERIDAESAGKILEARRPERFVFEWGVHHSGRRTTVEMNFISSDRGTVIQLIEKGFPDTPQGRRDLIDNASGWGQALTLLKFYVEHNLRF